MTQEELIQAASEGNVETATPDTAPQSTSSPPSINGIPTLQEFLPALNALRAIQPYLTAHPTFVPQTFQQQVQYVFTGGEYWIDIYVNGAWQKTKLDSNGFPNGLTQGDIFYVDATLKPVRLPAGLVNQVLKSGGSGANPSWQDGLGYQLYQHLLPANTITDQTASITLNIRPKFILGVLVTGSSQICWGWAVYAGENNTMLTNELAIPIPNNPAPLAGGFLQSTAGQYVQPPSVTANQITFHWQNNDLTHALTANLICLG
jgi:hypothetical protein